MSNFMLDRLAASGLVPEDVDATDRNAMGPIGGFTLPYYMPDGTFHPVMQRSRLEVYTGKNKYTQPPKDHFAEPKDATYPYLNAPILRAAGFTWTKVAAAIAPKKYLIVEGELKAACAMKILQILAIGIGGCWNGVRRDEHPYYEVHPDIAAILKPGDLVEVVFDGDLVTNRNVERAAGTLKRALERLGVTVRFVILPKPATGRGGGLDDFLMGILAADRVAAFNALPRVDGSEFAEDSLGMADAFDLTLNGDGDGVGLTVSNIIKIMQQHPHYRNTYHYDVMRGNLYRGTEQWRDAFLQDEIDWLAMKLGVELTNKKGLLQDSMIWLAAQPWMQRNPLTESLPPWDGVERLETMFIIGWGAADDEHVRAVGRNFLHGAMRRAIDAGCKMDNALVLFGDQGIGKSRSLEILAGPDLYVTADSSVDGKDFKLQLHSGWIIDMAELASLNHAEANHAKSVITTATDKIRVPYGVAVEEKKRRSVLVGTTNEERFLRDQTGSRRYWPITCGAIDTDWITTNRDQLLAEGLARANQDPKKLNWWTMPKKTKQIQDASTEISVWEELVHALISMLDPALDMVVVNNVEYWFLTSARVMQVADIEFRMQKNHMLRDIFNALNRVGGGKWESSFSNNSLVRINAIDRRIHSRGWRAPVFSVPKPNNAPLPESVGENAPSAAVIPIAGAPSLT